MIVKLLGIWKRIHLLVSDIQFAKRNSIFQKILVKNESMAMFK